MFESRCGVLCDSCKRKEQVHCKGCLHMERPFWGGTCEVKSCCESRGIHHCGECPEFPCRMLSTMGVEQGFDPAPKLEQCRRWAAEGRGCVIREISGDELGPALELAWRVFQEYESPEYGPEGTAEFYRSLHDPAYLSVLRSCGAYEAGTLVGVMATRLEGSHLALLFVDAAHQCRGIGRMLVSRAMNDCTGGHLTVNASPYAVKFYRQLGFEQVGAPQVTNGLRYTPMAWDSPRGEEHHE